MYIFLICKCKENQLLSAKEKKRGGGQLERRPSIAAFSEGHVVHDKRRTKNSARRGMKRGHIHGAECILSSRV